MEYKWEKGFVDRLKGKGQTYGKEQISIEFSKHVEHVFELCKHVCEKINALSDEKIAYFYQDINVITIWVKQYYLRATLDERGKMLFSSNGAILPFTKASPIESQGKVKWMYRDFNKNQAKEITEESIKLLFDEAFRNI
jgi:hypothetical protein